MCCPSMFGALESVPVRSTIPCQSQSQSFRMSEHCFTKRVSSNGFSLVDALNTPGNVGWEITMRTPRPSGQSRLRRTHRCPGSHRHRSPTSGKGLRCPPQVQHRRRHRTHLGCTRTHIDTPKTQRRETQTASL